MNKMYNIILNKNKSIGKVVFIVEGDKKEHTLLGHIFKNVLDYTIVDVKRNQPSCEKYISKVNRDSRIFLISAENSNIKSAGIDGKAYLDHVFSDLFIKYSLDLSNAAVYYIFDRDSESNLFCVTENLSKTLTNSRDNGIDANGLLLLSYPCIEAYIKTCIDDAKIDLVESPKALKEIVDGAKYQYREIDKEAIVKACSNMLLGINQICRRELEESDLDNFEEVGSRILIGENELYLNNRQYMVLSLLSVAFLDLGILRVTTF